MTDMPWLDPDESEEADFPIAIVRSRPIRLRFVTRGPVDTEGNTSQLVTFFRDRRLARRSVTREEWKEIRSSTAWREPVPIVGLARYANGEDTLLMSLGAETAMRFGPFDSDEGDIWLGYRFRPSDRQAFPGDLDREARDLFGSLLQGHPDAAIGKLFDEARREADWRHDYRMAHDGHEPGRDIAEAVWSNRIRKEID
jgi:hypothetical protein